MWLMSSCHEWIALASILSYYDKMIMNNMDKEAMLEYTTIA